MKLRASSLGLELHGVRVELGLYKGFVDSGFRALALGARDDKGCAMAVKTVAMVLLTQVYSLFCSRLHTYFSLQIEEEGVA